MTYILLTALILALAFVINQKDYKSLYNKPRVAKDLAYLILGIIMLLLILFAGLRNSYNDTGSYIKWFNSVADYSTIFNNFSFTSQILFDLSAKVISDLGGDFHLWFAFNSALFIIPSLICIYKYSKNFFLSMVAFMCLSPFLFSLAGMRQTTAIGVLMIGYMMLLNKRYFGFILMCSIAQFFHSYAFVFLLIIPILKCGLWKKGMIVTLVTCVLVTIFLPLFGDVIESIMEALGKVQETEDMFETGVTIFRFLVYFLPVLVSLLWRKQLSMEFSRKDVINANTGMLASFTMTVALSAYPVLFGRVAYFFSIMYCISFGNMLHILFKKESKGMRLFLKLIFVLLFVVFISYEIYSHTSNFIDPFKF